MIFLLALVVTALSMLLLSLLVYTARRPQMQTQLHLERMIAEAEAQRAAHKKQKRKDVFMDPKDDSHYLRDKSFRERIVQPMVTAIENWLMHFAPRELNAMMENMLLHLGVQETWSVRRLAAGWVLAVALGGVLAILGIYFMGTSHFTQKIAIVAIGLFLGAAVPFVLLQSAIRRRQAILRKQLPEFLDFLCVSVQAGLSFDGAVAKIVYRMKGPLTDEFKRMLRDMSLGMNRQRTLTQLARRCDLEEMYLFTASVIQAEHLGTSMSRTLKQQADNIRDRHRQTVRAAALKAPVKILFPMILFIFPSIFVIVVLPSALTLLKALGK
ncbi:tight adherence protein C [Selenomonas ruminantium]|uniref:Tight adherence protein C n=1 Tax=Selenomonas ruminantium TaxID=971 RepID=A0A1M6S3N5_SELRU|nr:type II secretion system F family protein [Selenomonas ruminantium]SHK39422.1 tight adherence protein C [Selenomonas ruminantium]